MDKIRCLVMSTANGDQEEVLFTQDFDSKPDFFTGNGFTVDSDTLIDDVLPDGFPRDYNLVRK